MERDTLEAINAWLLDARAVLEAPADDPRRAGLVERKDALLAAAASGEPSRP